MADVTLTYDGDTILELSTSGTKTIKTGGKFCSEDIELTYVNPSGGLPSIISKIDGGSFTPSSDTVTGNYTISHNLGEAPKGVAIWATNMDRVAYSVRSVDYYLAVLGNYILEQVNTNAVRRELSGAVASGDIGSNSIKMTISQNYYKANTTYNWLAWA